MLNVLLIHFAFFFPNKLQGSTYNIGGISSDEAVNFMFSDGSGLNCIGVEAFFHMLIQSGASEERVSKM